MVDETTMVGGMAAGVIISASIQILKLYLPDVQGRLALGITHILCLIVAVLAVWEQGASPSTVTFYSTAFAGFFALALYTLALYTIMNGKRR